MTRVLAITTMFLFGVVIDYAGQSNQANSATVPSKKNSAKTAPTGGKPKPASSVPAASASKQNGATVFVDPVTHQIREATPEEIGTLSGPSQGTRNSAGATRALSETPNGPTQLLGAGGAIGMTLGSDFDTYLVVTKTPDGKLKTEEVTGHTAAQDRVLPGKAPKTSHEK